MGISLRSRIRETLEPVLQNRGYLVAVDETYISIKAKWHDLYRAVDKNRKSVDFLLRRDRGIAAAQAVFRKARRYKVDNRRACP
jgi:transposase-like protein